MEAIQGIISVLESLLDTHERMLSLEKKKQSILVEDRTTELLPLLQDQSKLVKQIASLEQGRQEYVRQFMVQKGLTQVELPLSDLIKLETNSKVKEKITQVSGLLHSRLEELKQLNLLNQQLIDQSLSYIDYTLRLITEEPASFTTYNRGEGGGPVPSTQQRRFFDTKA